MRRRKQEGTCSRSSHESKAGGISDTVIASAGARGGAGTFSTKANTQNLTTIFLQAKRLEILEKEMSEANTAYTQALNRTSASLILSAIRIDALPRKSTCTSITFTENDACRQRFGSRSYGHCPRIIIYVNRLQCRAVLFYTFPSPVSDKFLLLSRSTCFITFPLAVLGSSSVNHTQAGAFYQSPYINSQDDTIPLT